MSALSANDPGSNPASNRTGDQARASVSVALPPAQAFRVFTEEVDLWWRRGKRFRNAPEDAPRGIVRIEPGVGGRLFESFDTPQGECVVQIGRTLVWDPPQRLVLQWRATNFAPHEHTEVELTFAPAANGTLVTLTHRGWAAIRHDHPVRHGQDVPAFIRMMGLWWGDQLTMLRLHAAGVQIAGPKAPDSSAESSS